MSLHVWLYSQKFYPGAWGAQGMRGAFCTLGMPQTSTYTSKHTSNTGSKFIVIPSGCFQTLMDAADPELSAGKFVHEGHMKKWHFALFQGQFFTDFARCCYGVDGAIEAWVYQLRWRKTVKNWVRYNLFCVRRYWRARKWQFGTCVRTFEKDCTPR